MTKPRRPLVCRNCGDPFDDADGPDGRTKPAWRPCPSPSPGRPLVDFGIGGHMYNMDEPVDLLNDLSECANIPLTMEELERVELAAIDIMTRPDDPQRDRASMALRMAAEIRKARDCWDEQALTDREIDSEIAEIRGLS